MSEETTPSHTAEQNAWSVAIELGRQLRTANARIAELEEAGRVLAEEVAESRVHLVRATHPDTEAPPNCPYFELNTHARQYDDCNMADARRDVNTNPTAAAMVRAAQEKRT